MHGVHQIVNKCIFLTDIHNEHNLDDCTIDARVTSNYAKCLWMIYARRVLNTNIHSDAWKSWIMLGMFFISLCRIHRDWWWWGTAPERWVSETCASFLWWNWEVPVVGKTRGAITVSEFEICTFLSNLMCDFCSTICRPSLLITPTSLKSWKGVTHLFFLISWGFPQTLIENIPFVLMHPS